MPVLSQDDIDAAVLRSAAAWLAHAARTLPGSEGAAGFDVLALSELLWQLAGVAALAAQGDPEPLLWLRDLVADGIDEREPEKAEDVERVRMRLYMRDYRARHRQQTNTTT